jgi:hypothetical protein
MIKLLTQVFQHDFNLCCTIFFNFIKSYAIIVIILNTKAQILQFVQYRLEQFINAFLKNNMNKHISFLIFMLGKKIKIEIDINNDESFKTIWDIHMREIRRWRVPRNMIKLINLYLLYHYSYIFSNIVKVKLQLKFKDIFTSLSRIHKSKAFALGGGDPGF